MANIPIYSGSVDFTAASASFYSAPPTGSSPTPFGFYDGEVDFKTDADKVTDFCARRLGYPIENVELQDIQFWASFEEAVTVYGNELYAFKVRDNLLTIEGTTGTSVSGSSISGSSLNESTITPSFANIVRLSQQFAEEAGTGGNVDWLSGSINLTSGVQDYDLAQWALDQNITGGIEIKQVYYEETPAVSEMYSPWAGMGGGFGGGAAAAGFAGLGYGPGMNFLLMPLSFDMQTIQAIEMSNQVRLSNYTFQLINNKLRIFPVPTDAENGDNLWFEYMLKSDEDCVAVEVDPNKISNISQVPYRNIDYDSINSVGRSWIFEYTLALSKEILGYVRGKYTSVPIPGAEVTLNQADLLTSATADKNALVDRLRAYFDDTSRQKLLERKQAESVAMQSELDRVPMTIFVG